MSRLKSLSLAGAVTTLLTVHPLAANAQNVGQTPENAQRYLSTSLPERYTVIFPEAPNFPMDYRRQTSARPDGTCITVFEHSARGGTPFTGNPGDNVQRVGWADVEEIRQDGTSVVQLNRDGLRLVWQPASEAAAARLAYAMEFLRQHCDPAAGTGF